MNANPIVYLEGSQAWLFDGKDFIPCDFATAKKHNCGMSISLSKLHIGSFKFPSSLSPDELEIQTEIKMHEEGGLNVDYDYELASYKHVLEFESSTLVEAFASSIQELHETCLSIVKETKHIDWIVPSFITYSSYYIHNEIEAKTDLFYYLGEEESYAVLFNKGSYVAHRRIISLNELAKELNCDLGKCKSLLSKNGLDENSYIEEDASLFVIIQDIFSKQIEKIVHTINHKRGLFGIEGIDRVYIDFEGHKLKGIETVFAAYGMEHIEVSALVCEDKENSHRFIKAMYIYACANELNVTPLNLSPYQRQAPWFSRHSGHFIMVAAGSLILSLMYPGYFYIEQKIYEGQILQAQSRLLAIEVESKHLGKKLISLKTKLNDSKKQLQMIDSSNKVYALTLDTLPTLMNNRLVRQKMMYDALEMLKVYKLSTISIDQNTTHNMQIHVIADYHSRDNIAKFMQAWMRSGYKEARTKEIYLDENIYESTIEVWR